MKKTTYKTATVFAVATLALAITGCASSQTKSTIPVWVTDPPQDEEFIYGTGVAVSTSEARGWKLAENRARASISYQIIDIVEGMQIDFDQQAGPDGAETGESFFEDVSRQLTTSILSGARVVKRGTGKENTYYVMTSYSVSTVKTTVNSLAESAVEKAEMNRQSANAALNAMDKALAVKREPVPVESGSE
ncbi:MAG: LPP20 family lipoprotein [Treponema sp.]|nr:LPP20 family lipoprotein [Treponema sp.]